MRESQGNAVDSKVCSFELLYRPDGVSELTRISPALCRLWEIDADLARADFSHFIERIHPDDLPRVRHSFIHALSMGTPLVHQYRIQRPRQGQCWVECRQVAIPLGQHQYLCFAYITPLEQEEGCPAATTALAEEARVGNFAPPPLLLWASDSRGQRQWLSRAWDTLLGPVAEDTPEQRWRSRLHPDDRSLVLETMAQAVRGQAPDYIQYRLKNGSGKWIWILEQAEPQYDSRGNFFGHSGISIDISEQKGVESALIASRKRLLQTAQAQERALFEERRRIAQLLHDELGQQLTCLNLGLGLLSQEQDLAAETCAQIQRLQALTQDAMGVTRQVTASVNPPVRIEEGLMGTIEQLVMRFNRSVSPPIRLQRGPCRCAVPCAFSDNHIYAAYRFVQEALTNALRHSRASTVAVAVQCTGKELEASVRDDGQGFAIHTAQAVLGLGLLGLRERAEALGGLLDIRSAPGQGTHLTFKVGLSHD